MPSIKRAAVAAVVGACAMGLAASGARAANVRLFTGDVPNLKGSQASLEIPDNPAVRAVYSWSSMDPTIGEVDIEAGRPFRWILLPYGQAPQYLVFLGLGDDAWLYAIVFFGSKEADAVAAVSVYRAGSTVTYVLQEQEVDDTTEPTVVFLSPTAGATLGSAIIKVAGIADEELASVVVNGVEARVDGSLFLAEDVQLVQGANAIEATATDLAGNVGTASIVVTVDDTLPPVVTFTSPTPGATVSDAVISVSGRVSEPVTSLTVEGIPATVVDREFTVGGIELDPGFNIITVEATDALGNFGQSLLQVTLDNDEPVVTVVSPPDGLVVGTTQVTVTGSVSEPVASLTIAGLEAEVESDLTFSLPGVPLSEGENLIELVAQDTVGNVGTASVHVTRDTTPPVINVTSPASGTVTTDADITVQGMVNEPVSSVTVNGVNANVVGQTFTANNVPLEEGGNVLTIAATDPVGNSSSVMIIVTRQPL